MISWCVTEIDASSFMRYDSIGAQQAKYLVLSQFVGLRDEVIDSQMKMISRMENIDIHPMSSSTLADSVIVSASFGVRSVIGLMNKRGKK